MRVIRAAWQLALAVMLVAAPLCARAELAITDITGREDHHLFGREARQYPRREIRANLVEAQAAGFALRILPFVTQRAEIFVAVTDRDVVESRRACVVGAANERLEREHG